MATATLHKSRKIHGKSLTVIAISPAHNNAVDARHHQLFSRFSKANALLAIKSSLACCLFIQTRPWLEVDGPLRGRRNPISEFRISCRSCWIGVSSENRINPRTADLCNNFAVRIDIDGSRSLSVGDPCACYFAVALGASRTLYPSDDMSDRS